MDIFRENGIARTSQREAIFEALTKAGRPVSAFELMELAPKGSFTLSTVYRALSAFEKKRLVLRIQSPDGSRSLFYLNTQKHIHHLICSRCSHTVEIGDCPVKEFSRRVSDDTGYAIFAHRLEFVAVCPDCLKKLK